MKINSIPIIKKYFYCSFIGIISGILVSLFLHSLQKMTELRFDYPQLIWGLPIVGLLIPWLYSMRSSSSHPLNLNFIFEEIHEPRQIIPWKMTPLIFISTLLTHLVGGSAGREGTALQISTSTADRLSHFFGIRGPHRKWVLMTGLSAGFSAALGAPLAGILFGMEVITVGRIHREVFVECLIASLSAWSLTHFLHTPHFNPMVIFLPNLSLPLFVHLLLLSVFIGLLSRFHIEAVRSVSKLFNLIPNYLRTMVGGFFLLSLYLYFPWTQFQGLGLETIIQSFNEPSSLQTTFIKLGLTILTLAAGFKGGEFVPLVFIGSTLASALAHQWQEPLSFFTALGFVSLFGAASKTPWTCTVLAMEYFGWEIGGYALLVNFAAFATAGPFGIYEGQKIHSHFK